MYISALGVIFLFHVTYLILESMAFMGTVTTVVAMKNAGSRSFRTGILLLLFDHIFRGFIKAYVFLLNLFIFRLCGFHVLTKAHKLRDCMLHRIEVLQSHGFL